eukprot:Awhi_evm2s6157
MPRKNAPTMEITLDGSKTFPMGFQNHSHHHFSLHGTLGIIRGLKKTCWIEGFSIDEISSGKIAKIFLDNICSRYGYPESLLTDQGSNFTSDFMKVLASQISVTLNFTGAYRHSS